MPRAHRAPRRRSRALTPAKSLAKVRALVLDMEEPLNAAIDQVSALRLIGFGLTVLDDDSGRAVLAAAWAAAKRLDRLKEIWQRMLPRR